MKIENNSPNTNRQTQLSLVYGIVFLVLYLSISISYDHMLVGIISGIINGTFIFYLNYSLPSERFWGKLKTRKERWDNFVVWFAVFMFTVIIYGLTLFVFSNS